jgi:hypothetical protein
MAPRPFVNSSDRHLIDFRQPIELPPTSRSQLRTQVAVLIAPVLQ